MALFEFYTPGDFLRMCDALQRRMDISTEAVERGGALIDAAFVSAWRERLRRWHEVRAQCGDFGSRMWASKWKPVLEDWRESQVEWEKQIERRTGRALMIPDLPPDENPFDLTPDGDGMDFAKKAVIGVITAIVLVGILNAAANTRKA